MKNIEKTNAENNEKNEKKNVSNHPQVKIRGQS